MRVECTHFHLKMMSFEPVIRLAVSAIYLPHLALSAC